MYFKCRKYQLVENIIPATAASAGRFFFTDQPQLRSQTDQVVYIDAIETFSAQACTTSPLSNAAVAPVAAIRNAFLVLNVGGYEDLQYIPLAALNRVHADTGAVFAPFVRDLFGLDSLIKVDWSKSYVQLPAAPAAPPFAYLFGVYYRIFKPDRNKEQEHR